jgi:hypothetical protein
MIKIYLSALFFALAFIGINAQNVQPGPVNSLPNSTKKSATITAITPKVDKPLAPRNHGLNQHSCASHELTKKYYVEKKAEQIADKLDMSRQRVHQIVKNISI